MANFNPFRPAYLADPYPILEALRAKEPVHWNAPIDAWIVTSYADCLRILQDDDNFSSDPTAVPSAFGGEVARKRDEAPLGHTTIMGNSDPPEHTRLRAVVNRGFTPRAIEAARAHIEASVDAILEEVPMDRPFEVMSEMAQPLAVSTILQHIGVPRADFGQFRAWSLALMRARAEGASTPGVVEAAGQAQAEMFDYLASLAESREASPDESPADVLSVLLGACDDETIRPEEMLTMLIHISLAGNGPTAMALGNAIVALARHPVARLELAGNPGLRPQAVEELLRFDSPTHLVARFARQDVKVGSRTIRAGQQVQVMTGAANRDPARFAEPHTLDFDRVDNRHLSFGYGIHFCLGAPLARLELQIALGRFLERFGEYEVVAAEHVPNFQLRGLAALVVKPGLAL